MLVPGVEVLLADRARARRLARVQSKPAPYRDTLSRRGLVVVNDSAAGAVDERESGLCL